MPGRPVSATRKRCTPLTSICLGAGLIAACDVANEAEQPPVARAGQALTADPAPAGGDPAAGSGTVAATGTGASAGDPEPASSAEDLDALEYVAVANLDHRGAPWGRQLTTFGRRPPRVPTDSRGAVPPEEKLSVALANKLASPAGAAGMIDVVIGAGTDITLPRLPKLRRDLPRTAAENVGRMAQRRQAIDDMSAARRAQRGPLQDRVAKYGTIGEEFPMGNAFEARIPVEMIQTLQEDPEVLSIQLKGQQSPPPDVARACVALNTNVYRTFGYDGAVPGLYVGMIDTGARASHVQFTDGGAGIIDFHNDCMYGGDFCNDTSLGFYNPDDPRIGHGTASANVAMGGTALLDGRLQGISAMTLDTFNVYSHANIQGPGNNADAIERAIKRADAVGDDIIVAVVQNQLSATSPVAVAAHTAFDSGSLILASNGNQSQVTNVGCPANVSKVLGVGAYNAVTGNTVSQISGRVQGRIKPDLQMPTGVNTANSHSGGSCGSPPQGNGSNVSDTAICNNYGGTSAAGAASAGAAAIMYQVYDTLQLGNAPGLLNAAMLAGGDLYSPSTTVGAGRFRMQEVCGTWVGAARSVSGSSNVDVTVSIPSFRQDLHVAIWWPEDIGQAHNPISLRLIPPGSSNPIDTSTDAQSVWQIAGVDGLVQAGDWTIRLDPQGTLPSSQTVFYAAQAACEDTDYFFDPFDDLSNWTETGEGDWNVESLHSSSGYPSGGSGAPAGHSDNCDTECVLTLATPIDLSWAGTVTLELLRFVDSSIDAGENLILEVYDGSQWIPVRTWTDGSGDDNTWHEEAFDMSQYSGINNFNIRLRTNSSAYWEHVQVDDIRVRSGRP